MSNKKKYKLQVEFDIEVEEGDPNYLIHDEDQRQAAEELIRFLYENEELIKKHVLMILGEELDYLTEEDKESHHFDILPIIKEGISDIAWKRLNLKIGGVSSHVEERMYDMVSIKAEINPDSFKLIS